MNGSEQQGLFVGGPAKIIMCNCDAEYVPQHRKGENHQKKKKKAADERQGPYGRSRMSKPSISRLLSSSRKIPRPPIGWEKGPGLTT